MSVGMMLTGKKCQAVIADESHIDTTRHAKRDVKPLNQQTTPCGLPQATTMYNKACLDKQPGFPLLVKYCTCHCGC